MVRRSLVLVITIFFVSVAHAQTPKTYTSSEILMQIKKLNVLGSVLYIAAHPDDENTRLLAYLANEKQYRTGYLSLTRGDGGQNLIGDEQGIDLGLIRTQELLSARRIDGAEQFFSRAYDFGFCKSSQEALKIWGHDKILSDVVWVIRKFKPDVIIARFPEDSRAGHGHHAASGILAREGFAAAADPAMFPEQLTKGVTVWQAKRLLWNTFNFGSTNTQSEDQFKLEVGNYNPLLGKGYGEMAALSRSQHKSQGFGVAAQRGTAIEYFSTIKGDRPVKDLMDGVDVTWGKTNKKDLSDTINLLIRNYNPQFPQNSISSLIQLKQNLLQLNDADYKNFKNNEIDKLIENAGGIFMEATAANQLNVIGDSIKINLVFNNRTGINIDKASVTVFNKNYIFDGFKTNENKSIFVTVAIPDGETASQPYWIERGLENGNGSFDVRDQLLIGVAENYNYLANFQIKIGSNNYNFYKPILFKSTDPVKGELFQPIEIVNPVFVNSKPHLVIFKNDDKNKKKEVEFALQFNRNLSDSSKFIYRRNGFSKTIFDSLVQVSKATTKIINVVLNSDSIKKDTKEYMGGQFSTNSYKENQFLSLTKIKYDHIPDIYYNYYDRVTVLKMDLKISGSLVGYIAGAGDKVPVALEQMGYKVVMLKQSDITPNNLKQFDAVITGVRAYNTNEWMNKAYDALMEYVNGGGILLSQYNTSNQIGPIKAKIAPYPFSISRNRVTDETAKVNFLLPDHPALNYPNKITEKDFEGWIQERSIYNAENIDANYQRILSMKDPRESDQDGSLIIANYGKGRIIYTGLVFFRELPAGVPGAYRLFANLIAKDNKEIKLNKSTTLKIIKKVK